MMTESVLTEENDGENGWSGDDLSFSLPPVMTIETAEAVAAVFKELPIAPRMTLRLDVSQVESLSTPGLQIMLALKKSLSAQGGRLLIEGARPPFARVLAETGLQQLLG